MSMARRRQLLLVVLFSVFLLQLLHLAESNHKHGHGRRGCGKTCKSTASCKKGLVCLQGECKDDPDKETTICKPLEPAPGQGQCRASGFLHAPKSSKGCKDCCQVGKSYPQFKCSPPVTKFTKAILTVNDFQPGGDGGGASECDSKFHSNNDLVVALSTGWFAKGKRCGRFVIIHAPSGKSVRARVVDECDSLRGCDAEHGFYPPCQPNLVDASPSVWRALGVSKNSDKFGWMDITWSDAQGASD
ncbi:putative ripening-related protein 1 [Selaginella moellendorffii]|uniref:putative ripening-related protein 1 n=1 Tax=Selaginella moellendorffii TaxID=88036 RepID=UPI000D1CD122|nr:putative ripening-related protein 1 [Selaginella moellendorffii]|eukprot:XP_024517101.1 putative ripening-related protein 1 [Selaginella moellendorffii]